MFQLTLGFSGDSAQGVRRGGSAGVGGRGGGDPGGSWGGPGGVPRLVEQPFWEGTEPFWEGTEAILAIFSRSETQIKFCFKKTSKKKLKSRILVSQSPPKILPKCLQNGTSKKHVVFRDFVLEKCFVAKVPTSISYWFFRYFLRVGHFSSHRSFHVFSVQKTYQKPFQNEVRTLQKSMPKT